MKTVDLKLTARQRLACKSAKAKAVILITLLFRLSITVLSVFFIYTATLISDFGSVKEVSLLILFSVCVIILACFAAILKFLLHRWFFTETACRTRDFFVVMPVSFQLKIILIHLLRAFGNLGFLIFYNLPFAVSVFIMTFKLKADGINVTVFFIWLVFNLFLLLTGLYYTLASRQRTAFFDEELCARPLLTARQTVRQSQKRSVKECFRAARLKLSFFGWYCLCVLIFPVIFVMPYYMQTMAEYKKGGNP